MGKYKIIKIYILNVNFLTGLVVLFLFPLFSHASMVNTSSNSLNKGLVGHWTFDGKDLIRNVADRSGSGNTGYMSGFTSTSSASVSGKIGQGLKFDGVDDYVNSTYSSVLAPTGNISFGGWFKVKNKNVDSRIISKTEGGGFQLSLNENIGCTSFTICALVNVNSAYVEASYSRSNLKNNVWYHVIGVYDGSFVRLYINGSQVSSSPATGAITYANNNSLCIGNEPGVSICNGGKFFPGSLDDVRVYNRALSAGEIKELYNMGSVGKVNVAPTVPNLQKGLVGHWTFDGKDLIRNVADRSGLGNTGYMSGFTSTSSASVSGKIGQGLKFDGVDDWVNIVNPGSVLDGQYLTISAWIYPKQSANSYPRIIDRIYNGQFAFYVNDGSGSRELSWSLKTTGGAVDHATDAPNNTISFNKWQHVVLTWDGTNVKTYVNNRLIETYGTGLSGGLSNSTSDIRIGQRVDVGANRDFNGSLDDVRVYNRALSASEIKELYNMGSVGKVNVAPTVPNLQKGLVGHWTFDGKDLIRNVADRSGSGNHGYMKGFTSTSSASVSGKIGQGLKFDGVDDYVNLGTQASLAFASGTPWTVSSWVNSPPTTGFLSYMGGGNSIFKLNFGSGNNQFGFYANNYTNYSFGSSAAYVNKSQWFHLTWVSDNYSNISLYINGAYSTRTNVVTSKLDFKNIGGVPTNYAKVLLDDIRVYNRALSAGEVKELYLMGK